MPEMVGGKPPWFAPGARARWIHVGGKWINHISVLCSVFFVSQAATVVTTNGWDWEQRRIRKVLSHQGVGGIACPQEYILLT